METFRNLGGPPEDWEVNSGTIAERVAAVGRDAIDFRKKLNLGDGSRDTKAWQKVQSLGRESMQLVLPRDDPIKAEVDPTLEEEKSLSDDSLNDGDDAGVDPADPTADINAILDADYDTSNWSALEITSACNALLSLIHI